MLYINNFVMLNLLVALKKIQLFSVLYIKLLFYTPFIV